MSWSLIEKLVPLNSKKSLTDQAFTALALEAGASFVRRVNPVLASRVKLVSVKNSTIHAIATSAAAAEELKNFESDLFSAMMNAVLAAGHGAGISISALRVEIRGTLAEIEQF